MELESTLKGWMTLKVINLHAQLVAAEQTIEGQRIQLVAALRTPQECSNDVRTLPIESSKE